MKEKWNVCADINDLKIYLRGKTHAYVDVKIQGNTANLSFPTEWAMEDFIADVTKKTAKA